MVDERRVEPVYLRPDETGWHALCDACIRRPDISEAPNGTYYLVCVECVKDWSAMAANGFVERCQNPHPEFPSDITRP